MTCALPPLKKNPSQQLYETAPQDSRTDPIWPLKAKDTHLFLWLNKWYHTGSSQLAKMGSLTPQKLADTAEGASIPHWKAGPSNSALKSLDTGITHITFTRPEEEDRVQSSVLINSVTSL